MRRKVCRDSKVSDAQQEHWDKVYAEDVEFFGEEPSYPAQRALELFKKEGKVDVLELGGGEGRDTLFFARNGLRVTVIDYSESGLEVIRRRAEVLGLSSSVTAFCHDARKRLPFDDEAFDGCYSHMLFNMAFASAELESLSREVWRVLKPNGVNVYTVRTTSDKHYGVGLHRGEDMFEVDGFVVHFFSREMVERLAVGFEILGVEEFEEGELPRKLFLVTLRKKS